MIWIGETHRLPVLDLVHKGEVGGGDGPLQLVAVAPGLAAVQEDGRLAGGPCSKRDISLNNLKYISFRSWSIVQHKLYCQQTRIGS